MAKGPSYLDAKTIAESLPVTALIKALEAGLPQKNFQSPPRQHIHLSQGKEWLLMPSWQQTSDFGIKLITVFKDNPARNLDAIQGLYILFSHDTGLPLAIFDGAELTARRTAAVSALAAKYLANANSRTLLIAGTGKLVPYFVEAYHSIFDLSDIFIWGRNFEKAKNLAQTLQCQAIETLKETVSEVDIVTTLTRAKTPIIDGDWVMAGTHLNLVGGYRPDMREIDDNAIRKAAIFVDSHEGALSEAGDIITPLTKGLITEENLIELADLIGRNKERKFQNQITVFKSVGHAAQDLIAACMCYQNYMKR